MSTSFPIDREHPPSRLVYTDGERTLVLRPWTFADIDALIDAVDRSREELKRFMPWAHDAMTREGEYALVARLQANYHAGRDYTVGLFSAAGEVLGGAGLHARVALNPRGLEVGYWCSTPHAGKGWVTLATRMLVVLAFDHFACDRLQVLHDEGNVASRRVVEKCGFAYEGTMRNMTAAVEPAVRAGGYAGTGRHRAYALTPSDLPALPWVPLVRARMKVHDALDDGGTPHAPAQG